MRSKNNKEKIIITIACTMTVVIVLGFTLMQGTMKSKESEYVSNQTNTNLKSNISKDDYEILDKQEKDGKQIFIVLEKRKFNSKEIADLTNQVVKDTNKKFDIYLFDNKEKANNFEYLEEQTQTLVQPIDKNSIKIQDYYLIDKELETVPQYYAVESIKESKGKTKIELSIENVKNPEQALGQIKFLGQTIKELNPDKELGDLEITAYSKDDKNPSWKYTSDNKKLIINNEVVEL
jgi:hypothetical protein